MCCAISPKVLFRFQFIKRGNHKNRLQLQSKLGVSDKPIYIYVLQNSTFKFFAQEAPQKHNNISPYVWIPAKTSVKPWDVPTLIAMPLALSFCKSCSPGKIGLMQLCCLPCSLTTPKSHSWITQRGSTFRDFQVTTETYRKKRSSKTCLFLWRPIFEIVTLQQIDGRRFSSAIRRPAYGIR